MTRGATTSPTSPPEKRGIGMAFQNFALFPHMTAYDNIASALTARQASRAAIEAKVDEGRQAAEDRPCAAALRRASCPTGRSSARHWPARWSPTRGILLLDDPLRNVDAKLRYEMRLELPLVAEGLRLDRPLCDAGLQGGDGARRPHRRPARRRHRPDRHARPRSIASRRRSASRGCSAIPPSISFRSKPARAPAGRSDVGGVTLALPAAYAGAAGARRARLAARSAPGRGAASAGGFPVEVVAVTPLNEKIVRWCAPCAAARSWSSRPAGTPGRSDGKAHIAVDGKSALLFDHASGDRIGSKNVVALRNGEAA